MNACSYAEWAIQGGLVVGRIGEIRWVFVVALVALFVGAACSGRPAPEAEGSAESGQIVDESELKGGGGKGGKNATAGKSNGKGGADKGAATAGGGGGG